MKKFILFLLISFLSFINYAQNNAELINYYNQLKSAGYSQEQIEKLAKQNGYDINEIIGLPKTTSPIESTNTQNTIENTQTNYTASPAMPQILKYSLKNKAVFGSSYFKNLTYEFSPQINIATPESYKIGPGDELKIDLWGASEVSYQVLVSRQGRISIQGVGPIYLNGYTISRARERIKKYLSTIYKGIVSDTPSEKVNLELSLSKSRSVFVSIVGQVNKPGLYTLNGLSTVIHGLYSAAGIAENGSYRSIELIRSGKVVEKIDLYSFFVEGKIPNVFLQDQDVIRVPYYLSRVGLKGEVKTPGIYELKQDENLSDLLRFSGGLTAKAIGSSFFINRVKNSRFTSLNTSQLDYNLLDGDDVLVYAISDQKDNQVSVTGQVITPGTYSLSSAATVNDLLDRANGLSDKAYGEKASLIRKSNTGEPYIVSIDLDPSAKKVKNNINLQAKDSLIVYSNEKFYLNDKIYIEGKVRSPGEKIFYKGMTIKDLIIQADGLSEEEENLFFVIKSKDYNTNDYVFSKESEYLNLIDEVKLNPADVVSILAKESISPLRVIVSGEVISPGVYIQSKSEANIKTLIKQAGGLTQFASKSAIYIERTRNQEGLEELLSDSLFQSAAQNKNKKTYIPITNIDKPIYFENNDKLIIEPIKSFVEVSGEVIRPSIVDFQKGTVKNYLNKVGLSSLGSKRHTLVVYPNKEVYAVRKFLFFNYYPKVVEGSQIIVGKKPERSKLTSQELISVTSGLSTLVIVLSSLLSAN